MKSMMRERFRRLLVVDEGKEEEVARLRDLETVVVARGRGVQQLEGDDNCGDC